MNMDLVYVRWLINEIDKAFQITERNTWLFDIVYIGGKMGKEDVINYVMNSPANTNRAVLESLLNGTEESIDFGTMDFSRFGCRYIKLKRQEDIHIF